MVVVWATANSWLDWQETGIEGSFNDLDAEQIEIDVNDSFKLKAKTARSFDQRDDGGRCAEICAEQKMDDFRPMLPLILSLRDPGMQDRHWEKLSEGPRADR